jgi:hypothetical protein
MIASTNLISSMIKWHPMLSGWIAAAIANCAITALPSPDAASGKFYHWFFNFSHGLTLAIARVIAQYKEAPDAKSKQ